MKTKTLLDHLVKGWVIACLALANLVMMALFNIRGRALQAWSGYVDPILDVKFGYSPAFAHERIRALGEGGRQIYALTQLTLDIAYPIAYTLLFSLIVIRLYQPFSHKKWVHALRWVPFVAGGADVVENVNIAAMLMLFPIESGVLATIASVAGMVKWSFVALSMTMVGVGVILRLLRRFNGQ
jgi:hypothetical protein